jgi:hypothetical protein
MGLTTLTFSDERYGQSFAAWVNELVYSSGKYADFAKLDSPSGDEIVLSLACLPIALAQAAKSGVTRKRSAREFWSTVHADYAAFSTGDPDTRNDCIRLALAKAVNQVPDSHLTKSTKAQILDAIDAGGADLRSVPRRQPR